MFASERWRNTPGLLVTQDGEIHGIPQQIPVNNSSPHCLKIPKQTPEIRFPPQPNVCLTPDVPPPPPSSPPPFSPRLQEPRVLFASHVTSGWPDWLVHRSTCTNVDPPLFLTSVQHSPLRASTHPHTPSHNLTFSARCSYVPTLVRSYNSLTV